MAAEKAAPLKIRTKVSALLGETPREDIRSKRLDEKPYWHVERARIGSSPLERFVEPAGDDAIEEMGEEDIRAFCKDHIAYFKVPRYIHIVKEFPMTVTGKVQKFKLRELAATFAVT